jgi:hypothetical protein
MRDATLHYSTTPSLRRSSTACPTKPKVYIADRSSRPRKRGALHDHIVGEVGRTSPFAHTTIT